MSDRVKLARVPSQFETLRYPVTREDAAAEFADTTVTFADEEENLGRYISDLGSDSFRSPDDLFDELRSALPVEVDQSDGDA
jgi:hypothetical protein